jgi:hypothetical protein
MRYDLTIPIRVILGCLPVVLQENKKPRDVEYFLDIVRGKICQYGVE